MKKMYLVLLFIAMTAWGATLYLWGKEIISLLIFALINYPAGIFTGAMLAYMYQLNLPRRILLNNDKLWDYGK